MKYYNVDETQDGNCHSLCIAYITGFDDVPHWYSPRGKSGEESEAECQQWLNNRGLYQIKMKFDGKLSLEQVMGSMQVYNPGLPYILGCNSGGMGHSLVVMDGEILFNSGSDIEGPMDHGDWEVIMIGIRGVCRITLDL